MRKLGQFQANNDGCSQNYQVDMCYIEKLQKGNEGAVAGMGV